MRERFEKDVAWNAIETLMNAQNILFTPTRSMAFNGIYNLVFTVCLDFFSKTIDVSRTDAVEIVAAARFADTSTTKKKLATINH